MRYIISEEKNGYAEYPIVEKCSIRDKEYSLQNQELYAGTQKVPSGEWYEDEGEKILFLNGADCHYESSGQLFISGKDGDIIIPGFTGKIMIKNTHMFVEQTGESNVWLNKEKIADGTYDLEEGAVLLIDNCRIILKNQIVQIMGNRYTCDLLPVKADANLYEHFPMYKRSPRVIKRVEEKKIKMESAPASQKMGAKGLIQMILPPLCMLAITVAIGIVMKRGLYMMMSIGATAMTTIFSVVKYFQDKKEKRATDAQRKKMYEKYLLQKRKEIYRQWNKEDDAYRYNYPELSQIEEMIQSYSSRIYERSNMDDDFLTFSVGHYRTHPIFTIEDSSKELETEKDVFREEVQEIKQKYGSIDKPQVVDLKRSHLGLVGEKSIIHEQLKNYIMQIAFAQSYHDVQFILVYDKCYEEHFAWMRWLSHTRLRGLNVLGLIYSEKIRDQVLSSMQQIIKERKQKLEEEKKEARFLPHYVFVIDEPKMLMDHSIMEFLGSKDEDKLGFSIIYTSNQQANLPENIGTVILLENSTDGRLLLQEKELCNQKMDLYRLGDVDLEWMARNLGVLVHEQGMTSHIPESITFFEMYGIQKPEELQIQSRWSKSNSSKTLAVPLGARAADDNLELNLHEKAHGPHGLVAGTTGSGKSEIVQSYILSLAVNFHPYEVGFLLIDYKGGGMANLFKNLPHLLGTITNLDGSESMRALASIQAELRRRQKVFGAYDVNHINAYNDLFKEGTAKEPIPHLFIISDEFAELKKEQPEFMKELVSTARIGRSLGVHLILATQKPTGVVDDQIWTNSKFRLCLKVQNEADSKEVLHTPDAANITQAGRAYLQVGNNEIYELFQSAWSGATYIHETEKEVTQDNRIYLVNELGQGELINQDLRGSKAEQKAKETQLDVVVNYIHEVYARENRVDVAKPWLPSLPGKLVNPHSTVKKQGKVDLDVVLGIIDIPEEQEQKEYTVNLAKQGNILYVASSGYGKSVFLANAIMNLAVKNRVSNLNFYILDFGNNALISMSSLPHTADYIMLDDEEKFEKFRDLMLAEVQMRKRKLASAMVQNFAVYNETADAPMKAIVILIDNYDAIKEMGYDMENYFTRLSRDGAGLGIYMIITASRMSAVRSATMNSFRNKIGGVNFDENEVKTLVGRSIYVLPEIRGRALVKSGEIISIMQLFTPVDFENEVEYSRNLKEYAAMVKENYPNEEAPHIPILPEEITYESLASYPGNPEEIAIGLDRETVEPRGFTGIHMPFLILGDNGSGKTNVLRLILNQLRDERDVYLIDSRNRGLYEYQKQVHYLAGKEAVEDFANILQAETRKRREMLDEAVSEGKNPQEILAGMLPYYVIIDDIDDFCNQAEANLNIIAGRFEQAAAQGIRFIVSANTNKFKGTDSFTKLMKGTRNGVLLSDQGYLTIFPVKSTEKFTKPDGVLMTDGKGSYIRIPKEK